MNVLSLFDGISCGQLTLQRAGIPVENYFASEIDPYAIGVTRKHFPATIQLGDVTKWKNWDLSKIDLLIGGSPCQGFSNAGDGLNFEDPRSRLFFEFVKILKYYRPKYWMLENVRMKKAWQDVISSYLGVQPILINSALVSAQNRERLYWANFPITQPEDRGILLKDILESAIDDKYLLGPEASALLNKTHSKEDLEKFDLACANQNGAIDPNKSFTLEAQYYKGVEKNFGSRPFLYLVNGAALRNQVTNHGVEEQINIRKDEKSNCVVPNYHKRLNRVCIQVGIASDLNGHDILKRVYSIEGKSPTLYAHSDGNTETKITTDFITWRKLTPLECERLQTLPDNYTEGNSNTQRYKMIGNGWTVDVVAHIFECMKLQSDF